MFDNLARITRSERGGRTGGAGYEFQHNWVLFEAIQLLQASTDFAIVLEYHEDVVFLFPSDVPTEIELCQVKKRLKGRWTLNSLSKSKSGTQSLSPLGKLCRNYVDVGIHGARLRFSTNADFNFGDDGNSDDAGGNLRTRLADLDGDAARKCKQKIQDELDHLPADALGVVFERHFLQAKTFEDQSLAHLTRYLESIGHGHIRAVPLHNTLVHEIRRRATAEWPEPDSAAVLSASTVQSQNFHDWISQAAAYENNERYTDIVATLLDDCSPTDRLRVMTAVAAAESRLLSGNKQAHDFVDTLRNEHIEIEESILGSAQNGLSSFKERVAVETDSDPHFPALGLTLIVVINEIRSEIPIASEEPSEQEA